MKGVKKKMSVIPMDIIQAECPEAQPLLWLGMAQLSPNLFTIIVKYLN